MTEALRAEVPLLEHSGTISASLGRTLTMQPMDDHHSTELLQWRPGPRYLHDRGNPLPTSWSSWTRHPWCPSPDGPRLLDAARTGAACAVGDPYQLASIEAVPFWPTWWGRSAMRGTPSGTIRPTKAPIVACPVRPGHRASSHAPLREPTRRSPSSGRAVRSGDADGAIATSGQGGRTSSGSTRSDEDGSRRAPPSHRLGGRRGRPSCPAG